MLAAATLNLLTKGAAESRLKASCLLVCNFFGHNHLAAMRWMVFERDRALFPVKIVGT